MSMKVRKLTWLHYSIICIVGLSVGLTACSSGPSDSDFQAAIEERIEDEMSAMAGFGLGSSDESQIAIENLDVSNREALEGEAYRADVTFLMVTEAGSERVDGTVIIDKMEGGWKVTSLQ